MRPTLYWLTAFFVAVLAASAAERPQDGGAWVNDSGFPLLAVADPARSVLLGVGILAIAFTYRQAWESFRRR